MITPKVESKKFSDTSESCPRFIAYAAGDSYVDADEDLVSLIDAVRGSKEDVVIWDSFATIAAVVTKGGKVHTFGKHSVPNMVRK